MTSLIAATLVLALSMLPVGCTPTDPHSSAEKVDQRATVTRIIDGDTIEITRDNADGKIEKVRILGIDTPEIFGRTKECWGPEASEFAKTTLLDQWVTVERDPDQDPTDYFNRTLLYVVLGDGRDYSVLAAESGMAQSFVYENKPVRKHDHIVAAELRAMSEYRGLWGACLKENER